MELKSDLNNKSGSILLRREDGKLIVYTALDACDFSKNSDAWNQLFELIGMAIPKKCSVGQTTQPYGEQLAKHLLALMYYGKIPDEQKALRDLHL